MKCFNTYFLLITIFVFLQSCVNDNEPSGPFLSVGDKLPSFSVELNNGEIVSQTSLNGKIGVIVFFNTACPDCQKELPVIQELYDYYQDDTNLVIALIAREESESDILNYWNQNDLSMPFSPQENREVYSLFAQSGIPRIYISNPQTTIVFATDDAYLPSFNDLSSVISGILQN